MNHICEVCIILTIDLRAWLNIQNRETLQNSTPIISWQINNKKHWRIEHQVVAFTAHKTCEWGYVMELKKKNKNSS